jgi:hypothetical protein
MFNALPIAANAANNAVANTIAEKTVARDNGMPVKPNAFHPSQDNTAAGTAQQIMARTESKYDFMGEGKCV